MWFTLLLLRHSSVRIQKPFSLVLFIPFFLPLKSQDKQMVCRRKSWIEGNGFHFFKVNWAKWWFRSPLLCFLLWLKLDSSFRLSKPVRNRCLGAATYVMHSNATAGPMLLFDQIPHFRARKKMNRTGTEEYKNKVIIVGVPTSPYHTNADCNCTEQK